MSIKIVIANTSHFKFSARISEEMAHSAKQRGTGIAHRTSEYIQQKMAEGKAVIAYDNEDTWCGFCYIESWGDGNYIANSGLIVAPAFRQHGIAKLIKQKIFELSTQQYPQSKLFGLTTGLAVMKINSELGYKPVTFAELTTDVNFWKGCQSCVNFPILESKQYKNCLCTAMVYDPNSKPKSESAINKLKKQIVKVFPRLKRLKQRFFLSK